MHISLRMALCLPLITLAACEAVSTTGGNPVAKADQASVRSCIRAVAKHTGVSGGTLNTTIPVVETNQFIIDVPKGSPWTCYTDETGTAIELIETRLG